MIRNQILHGRPHVKKSALIVRAIEHSGGEARSRSKCDKALKPLKEDL